MLSTFSLCPPHVKKKKMSEEEHSDTQRAENGCGPF